MPTKRTTPKRDKRLLTEKQIQAAIQSAIPGEAFGTVWRVATAVARAQLAKVDRLARGK